MNNQTTIGILGSGTWGIALARLLHRNGHDVTVWSKIPEGNRKSVCYAHASRAAGAGHPRNGAFHLRFADSGKRQGYSAFRRAVYRHSADGGKRAPRSSRTDRLSWMLPRALSRTHS